MPITSPDALIAKGGILNTRVALHTAVTRALRESGLDPFPKARMTIDEKTYSIVLNTTERILREWGTPFGRSQIMRELSRRGYEVRAPVVTAVAAPKKRSVRDVLMIALPLVGLVGIVMFARRR